MEPKYKLNEKVKVSSEGGWLYDFDGVISSKADPIDITSGSTYQYLVTFFEPQDDISGGGPYRKAEILEMYLSQA